MSQEIPLQVLTPVPLQYATPLPTLQLRAVAIAQRMIMWVILAAIVMSISVVVGTMITAGLHHNAQLVVILAVTLLRISVLAMMMVGVYRLAAALRYSTVSCVLYVLAMVVPGLSLILLLVLNSQATKLLKANGIRVGLMGAKMSNLPVA